jgi:hypothetical protein
MRAMRATILVLLAAALAAAADEDYRALGVELEQLKADPQVVSLLKNDLRVSHRLEKLYQQMRDAVQNAQSIREQAPQLRAALRQQQARGDIYQIAGTTNGPGDPVGRQMSERAVQGQQQLDALELQAARQLEWAREALVELVASYREVKAAAVRQAQAEEAAADAAEKEAQAAKAAADEQATKARAKKPAKAKKAPPNPQPVP